VRGKKAITNRREIYEKHGGGWMRWRFWWWWVGIRKVGFGIEKERELKTKRRSQPIAENKRIAE
jgi:hypothetical protein